MHWPNRPRCFINEQILSTDEQNTMLIKRNLPPCKMAYLFILSRRRSFLAILCSCMVSSNALQSLLRIHIHNASKWNATISGTALFFGNLSDRPQQTFHFEMFKQFLKIVFFSVVEKYNACEWCCSYVY